jgi:hypothetical protein
LYYIKYSSLWFDLRILLKTIKVVILGQESRQPSLEPTHTPRPNDNTERRLDAA